MKTAKILLAATTLISIATTTLAFKAKSKFSGTLICLTTTNGTTFLNALYTLTGPGGFALFCTAIGGTKDDVTLYVVTPKA